MAFDGGYTAEAYTAVWSVWTYPALLAISFLCRRKAPGLIWLPALSLLGAAFSTLMHKSY
jgi:hypothetical protein